MKNSFLRSVFISSIALITGSGPLLALDIYVTDAPYNAVADDGINDSAAFTSAINAIKAAGGGTLYVPPGGYDFTSRIVITGSAWNLAIVGAGKGVSTLRCDNADGVLKIDNTDANSTVYLRDISFLALRAHAGTALSVINNSISSLAVNTLKIENVDIKSDQRDTDYFDYGIRGRQLKNTVFRDLYNGNVYGPNRPDSPGIMGLDLMYCNNVTISFAYSKNANTAISIREVTGSISFYRVLTVQCNRGMVIEKAATGTATLSIRASHTNALVYGMELHDLSDYEITGHLFFTKPFNPDPYVDLYAVNCKSGLINKSVFHTLGGQPRQPIKLSGSASEAIIRYNVFNAHSTNGAAPADVVSLVSGASASKVTETGNLELATHVL